MAIDWKIGPDGDGSEAQIALPLLAEWGQYLEVLQQASIAGETIEDGFVLANAASPTPAEAQSPAATATVYTSTYPPTTRELRRLDQLMRKWPAIAAKVRDAAAEYYQEQFVETWGIAPESPSPVMLENFFRLDTVYLSDDALGLAGECLFDDEHGIGFRLEKGSIEIGDADLATFGPSGDDDDDDTSDNAFDTWQAPADWAPPQRDADTHPRINPLHELRQYLDRRGFHSVPESVIFDLMSHDAMPESLREAGQAVARLPADGTGSLRIDLGLPGPDCATDRQEAATALRQQLPAIANIGLSVILAGLADDGTLTLPPRSRRHLLALAIQLYDLGLDVTLVSD